MKKGNAPAPLPALGDKALEEFIEAAPGLVGLTIDPAYRDGVKLNMRATANAARLVLEFELDDEAEPAPVFRA